MRDWLLNRTTGLPVFTTNSLGGHELVRCTEAQAVAQSVWLRLTRIKGEYFADLASGLPWFGAMTAKPFNEIQVRQLIQAEIMSVQGVSRIESLKMTQNKALRQLNVSVRIKIGSETAEVTI